MSTNQLIEQSKRESELGARKPARYYYCPWSWINRDCDGHCTTAQPDQLPAGVPRQSTLCRVGYRQVQRQPNKVNRSPATLLLTMTIYYLQRKCSLVCFSFSLSGCHHQHWHLFQQQSSESSSSLLFFLFLRLYALPVCILVEASDACPNHARTLTANYLLLIPSMIYSRHCHCSFGEVLAKVQCTDGRQSPLIAD